MKEYEAADFLSAYAIATIACPANNFLFSIYGALLRGSGMPPTLSMLAIADKAGWVGYVHGPRADGR